METSTYKGELVAKRALVIYEHEKTGYVHDEDNSIIDFYITQHGVDEETGELLEGRPLTREMLLSICSLVMPNLESVDYLSGNVLAYNPGRALMWWTPSATRQLFFSEVDGLESGEYPIPPTLFLVLNGQLHTWALRDNSRPVTVSTVYSSPFYNVYETGVCCMGNIKVPDKYSPGDTGKWESVFFNGTLTGHLPPVFSGIEPESLWKKIRGKKRFPVQYLRPHATLGTIIKSISRR